MVRTQIQLTEAQALALKDLAVSRGASMAELVREAVDQWLTKAGPSTEDLRARARAAAGYFRSGLPGLAKDHDRYLAEAYLPDAPAGEPEGRP